MRNELNLVLKEYFRVRLSEIKIEQCYTQGDLARILHMDRRTVAAILRGEHSMSGLTASLFFAYLTKDPEQEIKNIMNRFQEVLEVSDDKKIS